MSIEGSYELQARVTIVRAKETTAIHLPIAGGKAVVLDLKGDRGNSESPTATIRLKGLNPSAEPQGEISINIGTECAFWCKVMLSEEKLYLEIRRDNQVLFQWSGDVSQVVGKPLMHAGTVEAAQELPHPRPIGIGCRKTPTSGWICDSRAILLLTFWHQANTFKKWLIPQVRTLTCEWQGSRV